MKCIREYKFDLYNELKIILNFNLGNKHVNVFYDTSYNKKHTFIKTVK